MPAHLIFISLIGG